MTTININEVMTDGQYRYAILEQSIPYDWDDYGAYGAVVFDRVERVIKTYAYNYQSTPSRPCAYLPEEKNGIISALAHYKRVLGDVGGKYPFDYHKMIGGVFDGEEVLVLGYFNKHYSKEGFDDLVGLPEYYIVYNERTNQYTEATNEEMVGYKSNNEATTNRLLEVYGTNGLNNDISSLIHQVAYDMSYSASDRDMAQYCANKIAHFVNEQLNLPNKLQQIIATAECMREDIKSKIRNRKQGALKAVETKRKKRLEKVKQDLMNWAMKVKPQGSQSEWDNLVQRVLYKRYSNLLK